VRRALLALVVLAAVAAAGWLSSREPRLDSVAAAEKQLGIDLEELRVGVDAELRVVAAGPEDGPPVLLLHGFPELWYAWRRPMAALAAAGFRVYAPDQRGYGESGKPRDIMRYSIGGLAQDAARLIELLAHDGAFVAAHDFGGAVAWRLALDRPDLVRRLVVIGTPHPFVTGPTDEETVSWYRTLFQIPFLPEWLAGLGHWRIVTGMLQRTARPGAFSEEDLAILRSAWAQDGAFGTMVNWYRASYRHRNRPMGDGRVSAPTLVLAVPDDAFIARDMTTQSVRYLDDGRLVALQRGSHWVIQEEPEEISRILVEFFSQPAQPR
jgi:pimeloyl-ACP methyl ester carboxylesterase